MQILVACEESQAVTIALRKLGHEAYSCDLIPCSGGHPEWHIQQDVLPLLNGYCFFKTCDGSAHYVLGRWDMLIAFPPCTYLSNAGACRLYPQKGQLDLERYQKGLEGKAFFMRFLTAECPRIAVENPVSSKVFQMPPHSQEIQPWQFGHPVTKKTRLWLIGLPPFGAHRHCGAARPLCSCWHGTERQEQVWGRQAWPRCYQQGQDFPRRGRRNGGTMGRARDYLIISPPPLFAEAGRGRHT